MADEENLNKPKLDTSTNPDSQWSDKAWNAYDAVKTAGSKILDKITPDSPALPPTLSPKKDPKEDNAAESDYKMLDTAWSAWENNYQMHKNIKNMIKEAYNSQSKKPKEDDATQQNDESKEQDEVKEQTSDTSSATTKSESESETETDTKTESKNLESEQASGSSPPQLSGMSPGSSSVNPNQQSSTEAANNSEYSSAIEPVNASAGSGGSGMNANEAVEMVEADPALLLL
ncbi:MAG: hypothetical protein H0U70_10755 [Tatlockia sp.]|nr:hypothetical protein [Tatlockia sp.]